jgi:glycosyltransferase involved in cell wall biosynthesis
MLLYRRIAMLRWLMSDVFRDARAVAAISEMVRSRLSETYLVDPRRVFVAYPGIAPQWFAYPKADRGLTRRRLGLTENDLAVITVGRRVPDKGHEEVIEGIAALSDSLRGRVSYMIVGRGPDSYATELVSCARRRGVRLQLLGFLDDQEVAALYDACDLFAMLSRETDRRVEGFGLVYLEAGARGLPAVAAWTGGVPEVVKDGVTGIVLEPNRAEVRAAMERLLMNGETRARMGNAARAYASEFTWRRTAEETYGRFFAMEHGRQESDGW